MVPTSRKIWGSFVFALGLLWLLGGTIGYFEGQWRMIWMAIFGVVLVRLGWNLTHGEKPPQE